MQKKFVYSLICFLVLFLLITILKLSNPFGLLFLSGLNVFVLTLTPLLILTAYHLSRKANWLRFITFFPALIGLLLISLQFIIWVDYRYLIPNTRIKPLNEAEFKTDNDTLIKQLINHPKIDSIQELINDTDLKQIQEYDPNPNRQMVRMMQAISSLNDGHSFMHPFQLYPDSRFFPLNGYYFDDGYYITRTASAYDQIQNYRLIAINGISFDSIFTRMKTVIGADNLSYQKSMLDIYLFSANVLNGLGIIDSVDEAIFLLVDADGFKHDLHINSVAMPFWLFWTLKPTDESSPVNPAPRKKKYELHTSNSDLFLIFNMIENQSADFTIKDLAEEIAKQIDENQVKRLIIDLRANSGGNNTLYQPLIDAIKTHPQLNDSLHLFAFISRRTFSAAINFIDDLQLQTNVTLIGESPGAAADHYGDANYHRLPNSGLVFFLSTRHWQSKQIDQADKEILIDIPVIYRSTDYINRHDPWLDKLITQSELF